VGMYWLIIVIGWLVSSGARTESLADLTPDLTLLWCGSHVTPPAQLVRLC
jgi:hypothetical protein